MIYNRYYLNHFTISVHNLPEGYNTVALFNKFLERRVLPQFAHLPAGQVTRSQRREGFEAGNADKIFESTYSSQTGKT